MENWEFKMKKWGLIALVLLSQTTQAMDCRDAIVSAYHILGEQISSEEFSNAQFSDFNITVEEFNELDSTEQEIIYRRVKPIEVMVEESIARLNGKINRVKGTFYEFFLADELQEWRAKRDDLRSCTL